MVITQELDFERRGSSSKEGSWSNKIVIAARQQEISIKITGFKSIKGSSAIILDK